ncbi:HNH endonuclease [Vibrio renipiscarius]|uniref:HNH endonuclease n=1 Tax=Vibrio renipiscarius TaxID=1461322 RepID=UPI00354CBCB2
MRKTEHLKNKPIKLRFYSQHFNRKPAVDREVRENVDIFLGRRAGSKQFKYYRNLRDSVFSLTNNRCAYCGKYADLSIEHYRPKDGIAVNLSASKDISKPGYFWLASDWYNLHPTCTPCNTLKTREILDVETLDSASKVVGKGNYFPLFNNGTHAPLLTAGQSKESLSLSTKSVKREKPLIYNPSKISPSDIFSYRFEKVNHKTFLFIDVKVGISAYESAVARTTINVLGLNSKDQIKSRIDAYRLTEQALDNIEAIYDFSDDDCLEQLAELHSYISETENGSYLGMLEYLFWERLKRLAITIDAHLGTPTGSYEGLQDVANCIDRLL